MNDSLLVPPQPLPRPPGPLVPGRPEPADPDRIDELEEQLLALAPRIHATTQPFLVVLAEFDRLRGWKRSGQSSCAHWLARYCGFDLGTAREKVRAARALAGLPRIRAAMGRGELSFSQVRCLTRVATAEDEPALLELAAECSVTQLERMVRAWKKGRRRDELEWERERHESRRLSVYPDDDGMYQIHGRLTPEVGALLMRAIEAAGDALFRGTGLPEGCTLRGDAETTGREAAQRRADAVGLIAERALAAGVRRGGGGGGERSGAGRGRPGSARGVAFPSSRPHQRLARGALPGGAARGRGDAAGGRRDRALGAGGRDARFV